MKRIKSISVKIDEDTYDAIKKIAKKEIRTVRGLCRHIIGHLLADNGSLEQQGNGSDI